MELQELHEQNKRPKRFQLLMRANIEGMELYLDYRVDAVSPDDAVKQVRHRLETTRSKWVDLVDLNWAVHKLRPLGPPKKR